MATDNLVLPGTTQQYNARTPVRLRRSPVAAPPTALLGRDRERTDVANLLQQPAVRLVTLTGPGGVGKTRLALVVMAAVGEAYSGGTYSVDLAPLSDPELVLPAIAEAVGVCECPGQPLDAAIAAALAAQPALLLLDNLEHLLPAAHALDMLLAACSGLTILVTSRTPTALRGEVRYMVAPLALPDPGIIPTPANIADVPAVALFVNRAAAVRPGFTLTPANAPVIATICSRLDGLPLALELAAARVSLLSPRALLARLIGDDAYGHDGLRLGLLGAGPIDLPGRQRTLVNSLVWSEQLLPLPARALLTRLGVFVGGCSLEAIAEITARQGVTPTEDEPLDALDALVSANFLRPVEAGDDGGDDARFAMLETVRAYVVGRLSVDPERLTLAARHAAYYLSLAERAEAKLYPPVQTAWLTRISADLDNMRAALRHALTHRDAETALRLAAALQPLWVERKLIGEGRRWLADALALGVDASVALARGKALSAAGHLAMVHGDYAAARSFLEASLLLERANGDSRTVSRVLHTLGIVAQRLCDFSAARMIQEEALALRLGLDDAIGTAQVLHSLGQVLRLAGELDAAHHYHSEALSLVGNRGGRGLACIFVGYAESELALGQLTKAHASFIEALTRAAHAGELPEELLALEGVAAVTAATDPARAARLWAAAAALRESSHVPLPPDARAEYDQRIADAQRQLSSHAWAVAWEAGLAFDADAAVAFALAPTTIDVVTPEGKKAPPVARLTPREREVASLIAGNHTNRQIAASLSIGERTVDTHVANILRKLDFETRTQIAEWSTGVTDRAGYG